MSDSAKISNKEFLEAVLPDGECKNVSVYNQETVFKALFDRIGTDLECTDLPKIPAVKEVAALNARRKAILIRFHDANPKKSIDKPKTSDYIEVALGGYIKAGGDIKNFYKDFDKFKEEYESGKLMSKELVSSRSFAKPIYRGAEM